MKNKKYHIVNGTTIDNRKALCGQNRNGSQGFFSQDVFKVKFLKPDDWCLTCKKAFNADIAGVIKLN